MKLRFLVLATVALLAVACSDDNDNGGTGPGTRMYNQVQRLGNPLVSEVFLPKKEHAFHGSIGPGDDAASFTAGVKGFNVLSIVVEVPASMLTSGGNSKIGVWGTISR